MSVVALCEEGLIIDLFGEEEARYPASMCEVRGNTALGYWGDALTFYDIKKKRRVKEYSVKGCKQIQVSDCGEICGALTIGKELLVYARDSVLCTHTNVTSFSLSLELLCLSRGSLLSVQGNSPGSAVMEFSDVFYFRAFGDFLVLVQRSREGAAGFKLSIVREITILEADFANIEKIDTKSDGNGCFLFLITSKYVSSSYYGREHLYFFEISTQKFREVDVLDPPLFFSFLNSRFVVCSGHQPSMVSVYDYQCSVIKSFPAGVRNRVYFNAHQNIVAFCGFENLSGNIEIYDVQSLELIAKFKVLGASVFLWSPSGSYFIVSTTNYMKEDNGAVMYDYYGREISRREFVSLAKIDWLGDVRPFVVLERPKKLVLQEEPIYTLPSFGHLKVEATRKKGSFKPKAKKNIRPAQQGDVRTIEDIKRDIDEIKSIKARQDSGTSLTMEELNKLLKENSIMTELKKQQKNE